MLGVLTLGTALVTPAPASAAAGLKPAPAGTRAMWLWHTATAKPSDVLSWARARGVKEIFVYVDAELPSTPATLARVRELKRGADVSKIRLTALGGEPEWATDHASALAWQRAVLGTRLFTGSHVDVEPYVLPQWQANRAGLVSGLVKLLERLQAADPRPLEADVPAWYGIIPAGTGITLADAVLARVNAITVMSYRDTAKGPNSMMDISTDLLTRGSRAGRPVRLGAETAPLSDCVYCTFHEEGRTRMTTVLSQVDAAARAHPAFAGIAIHHYTSWRTMRS
ncbi:hypothetical protein ACFFMN_42665 [Planobispora siamensis]|uniref:Amidase n=1 Tax=Planobispora siamensis TaxID=936338 RepID=A0A8J3WM83_9ACTN|nr:hypothetical protein [Planobispora siamensis]GIH96154.1 hypothetical protein Psi01_67840 [Planobispora siamensis]